MVYVLKLEGVTMFSQHNQVICHLCTIALLLFLCLVLTLIWVHFFLHAVSEFDPSSTLTHCVVIMFAYTHHLGGVPLGPSLFLQLFYWCWWNYRLWWKEKLLIFIIVWGEQFAASVIIGFLSISPFCPGCAETPFVIPNTPKTGPVRNSLLFWLNNNHLLWINHGPPDSTVRCKPLHLPYIANPGLPAQMRDLIAWFEIWCLAVVMLIRKTARCYPECPPKPYFTHAHQNLDAVSWYMDSGFCVRDSVFGGRREGPLKGSKQETSAISLSLPLLWSQRKQ